MFHILRKYQQPIMIVTTGVIVIAFVWLYNGTSVDRGGVQPTYKVYGRTISQFQVDKAARRFQVALALNMNDFVMGLAGNAMSQEQALENFVWNSFVLDHEAKRLGVAPTDQEVFDGLKEMPAFQTNGQFDPLKYQTAVQNFLAPNGFTETQLEDLMRDQIRLAKLTELVGSGVVFTPSEYRALYTENYQKMKVAVVDLKRSDFSASIVPTEEEIAKYYEDHKPQLNSDEKRVVSYVQIELDADAKKLTGKDRVVALQKQSDLAGAFGQALLDGTSFADAAKKFGLTAKTTAEFTEGDAVADFASPMAVGAAFRLTESDPNSDAIPSETGFYVLHLEKVVPKRPLTLEEARTRVVDGIKNERGEKALREKAQEVHAKLAEALKGGKTFDQAATEAGVKVENIPAFSLAEPPTGVPFGPEVAGKAIELPVGGLSEFTPTSEGGLFVYLEKREPIDPSKLAKDEETQLPRLRDLKRLAAFRDWLQLRRQEAGVKRVDSHNVLSEQQQQEVETQEG